MGGSGIVGKEVLDELDDAGNSETINEEVVGADMLFIVVACLLGFGALGQGIHLVECLFREHLMQGTGRAFPLKAFLQ